MITSGTNQRTTHEDAINTQVKEAFQAPYFRQRLGPRRLTWDETAERKDVLETELESPSCSCSRAGLRRSRLELAEVEPRTQNESRRRSEFLSASSARRAAAAAGSSSAEKKASDECVESVEMARRTDAPLLRRRSPKWSSAGGVPLGRPSGLGKKRGFVGTAGSITRLLFRRRAVCENGGLARLSNSGSQPRMFWGPLGTPPTGSLVDYDIERVNKKN